MMKNNMKRLSAFLLAFILVLSMCWTDVLAETTEQDDAKTYADQQAEEIVLIDTTESELAESEKTEANVDMISAEANVDMISTECETDLEDSERVMEEETFVAKNATASATNYLTFTAEEANCRIELYWISGEDVEYSFDEQTWNLYTIASSIRLEHVGDSVCFRGKNVKTSKNRHFYIYGSVAASGSVTSLTDGAGVDKNVVLEDNCYNYMFSQCDGLTTAPELPATTLSDTCYYYMFDRCTALRTAPALPATSLTYGCYAYMFTGCSNLLAAPELPATVLSDTCYYYMFDRCTALKAAPALPATTLADSCYSYMFSGCSSLTAAPALPATTLADYCYSDMFSDCSSLTGAPKLPATVLADVCYYNMFKGCSNLTSAPELPAMVLTSNCYNNMFRGCSSLTSAPKLPATVLADSCYYCMFYECRSLTVAPDLPATTLADSCYYGMFSGCRSLTSAPELPAKTLTVHCYQWMFETCRSLTVAPKLPATVLMDYCYASMFNGCSQLLAAPDLPATSLADGCYYRMFEACESITTVPQLPARTLAKECYYGMFMNCSNLIIKENRTAEYDTPWSIPATETKDNALNYMFLYANMVECGEKPALNTTYYIQASPSKVTLSQSSLYIPAGQTSTLTANVLPANATDKSIIWSSSNAEVATVSSTGLVKGLKRGMATITAKTSNGISASCKVSVGFSDVPANAWYLSTVNWAVNKKITSGVGSSGLLFKPDDVCSRAQIVTFLWNAAGQPSVKGIANPFTDVKSTDWYYSAVLWAVSKKITNGTTATTFSPNAECTRAQVVTFLWNWAGQPKTSNMVAFTDVKSTAYYYPAVKWAVYAKVTNGKNATTFAPEEKCTRAQVVTFLYNYFGGK